MERPLSHEIDELAQRVFRAALPAQWIVNEQRHDYGKDYVVELVTREGIVTGVTFFVQLKGQKHVRLIRGGDAISFSLETKHAEYYVDKLKDLPIFLVVVDVTKQLGWWLFLQERLKSDEQWRSRSTLSIRIPTSNKLDDAEKLRQGINDARSFMKKHNPGTIADAYGSELADIQKKDNRFNLEVRATKDGILHLLSVKEEVKLGLTISRKNADAGHKFRDLVGRGMAVEFDPGEVSITGSALFDEVQNHKITLRMATTFDATLSLTGFNEAGIEIGKLESIPGQMTGGRSELTFRGGLPRSPFMVVSGPIMKGGGYGKVTMNMKFGHWNGQRITHLAWFSQLLSFFKEAVNLHSVRVGISVDGNQLTNIAMGNRVDWYTEGIMRPMTIIEKGRYLAQHFKIDPIWNLDTISDDTLSDIEQLFDLVTTGSYAEDASQMRYEVRMPRSDFEKMMKINENPNLDHTAEMTFDIFGTPVSVDCVFKLSSLKVHYAEARVDEDDFMLLDFTGSPGATRTVLLSGEKSGASQT